MLGKLATLAATLGLASAYEQQPREITLADEPQQFLKEEMSPEELIVSTGSYPCIFQVGDSFYDYTPFKVAYAAPVALWYAENPLDPTSLLDEDFNTLVFGWCQQLSDIASDNDNPPITCQNQHAFAGRATGLPTDVGPESNCFRLSDGEADDIEATAITGIPKVSIDEITENPFVPQSLKDKFNSLLPDNDIDIEPNVSLDGISLKYTKGDKCEDGSTATFTVNMYCNDTMKLEDFAYNGLAYGPKCSPTVDIVSGASCARLSVSQLWEYLDQYAEYFGAFFIVIGVALVLFGRKLIKPAVFFAGLITCTLFACLLFYSVYFTKTSQVEDFWFFLGGGILTGIIVGILLSCFVKLGAAILAGWGGFCIGLILNESIVYRAEQEWDQ